MYRNFLFLIAAATQLQATKLNPSTPPSGLCKAFNQLAAHCNNTLSDQIQPLNSTHIVKCSIQPASSCSHKWQKEIQFTMQRTTWWHCNGSASSCLTRMSQDIYRNLQSSVCSINSCHRLPAYFPVMRNLALRALTSTAPSGLFGDELAIGANLMVQKSRFCRFDLDLFANMIEYINYSASQLILYAANSSVTSASATSTLLSVQSSFNSVFLNNQEINTIVSVQSNAVNSVNNQEYFAAFTFIATSTQPTDTIITSFIDSKSAPSVRARGL